jgi:hypothetical protein
MRMPLHHRTRVSMLISTMWIPLYSRMWILMLIIHYVNASIQQDVNTDVDYPLCECLCTAGREYWCWLSTMWMPLYSRMWILMLIIHDVNTSVHQDVNTDVDYPRCECLCTAGCEYWCWLSTMWMPLYRRMWILILIVHDVNIFVQQDVNTDIDYPRCECLYTAGCEYWCWLSTMWMPLYSRMWILMLIIHYVNASIHQDVNTDVDYPRCECLCTAGREYWCWLSTMWMPLYSRTWILILIIHDVNIFVQQDVKTDVDYPRCEYLYTVGCEYCCWLSTMWIPLYSRMWILMLIIHDVNAFVQQDVNTDVDYPRCEHLCTAGCEYWCWLSTMWTPLYSRMWIMMLINLV